MEPGRCVREGSISKRRDRHSLEKRVDRAGVHLEFHGNACRREANFYLTKPSPERLQPALVEEELTLFADELVLFAERAFEEWEALAGSVSEGAGKHVYDLADKQSLDRSFGLLKQLINELSSPNDVTQVAATITRVAMQYLDRVALFVAGSEGFTGVYGFGATGGGEDMIARVGKLRIGRNEDSVLGDVADSRKGHRGKIRRTAANVRIVEAIGTIRPTEIVALPIVHDDELIGVLYGDNAEHQPGIDTPSGLEIFLSQAGYALRKAVLASTSLPDSAAVSPPWP